MAIWPCAVKEKITDEVSVLTEAASYSLSVCWLSNSRPSGPVCCVKRAEEEEKRTEEDLRVPDFQS